VLHNKDARLRLHLAGTFIRDAAASLLYDIHLNEAWQARWLLHLLADVPITAVQCRSSRHSASICNAFAVIASANQPPQLASVARADQQGDPQQNRATATAAAPFTSTSH
jgi:hypothetical protein